MLCHLQSISSGLMVGLQGIRESHPETTEPSAVLYRHVKYCRTSLLSYLHFSKRVLHSYLKYHFHSLCIIVRPHCWIACAHWAISPAGKLLHIVWLGLWQSQVWSVFRWDLNVEQAKEVFNAAHDSLFAMIEQVEMPHTTVCQAVKVS